MRARDLAQVVPVVDRAASATEALRILCTAGLPGLVVDMDGVFVVVPASQVLRGTLPRYVLDDPSLARVWDEASADELTHRLGAKTAGDLVLALDRDNDEPGHVVEADATVVEMAAVMSAARLPLVAVVDHGAYLGVVTVNRLVETLIG
jgi:CBS domain-containing protein